jgi:hypothetical protein
MFILYRTRKGKLKEKIQNELDKSNPSIDKILMHVDEYEKNNLNTIKKLNRKKVITLRKINGALKQTINIHGNITMNLIHSASKRIYGNLLSDKKSLFKIIIEWTKSL